VNVGVNLFSSPNCSGVHYASKADRVTVVRGKVARVPLTFDFSQSLDGGIDGGMDGGACHPAMCVTPPICHGTPGTCGDAGCEYPLLEEGSDCGDSGVCNMVGECGSNVCAFRDAGAPCDIPGLQRAFLAEAVLARRRLRVDANEPERAVLTRRRRGDWPL
jgi:hypothetical protein